MIGDLSEYELANLEYDRLFRSRKSQREIGGQATAVGSGPGVRILLPPAASQERTLRDLALDLSVLTEPEGFRRSSDQLNYRVGVLRLKRLG